MFFHAGPYAPTFVTTSNVDTNSLSLSWRIPDGNVVTPPVKETQARYFKTQKPTDENVAKADFPLESLSIQGLSPNTNYTIATTIRTTDPLIFSDDEIIYTDTGICLHQ